MRYILILTELGEVNWLEESRKDTNMSRDSGDYLYAEYSDSHFGSELCLVPLYLSCVVLL